MLKLPWRAPVCACDTVVFAVTKRVSNRPSTRPRQPAIEPPPVSRRPTAPKMPSRPAPPRSVRVEEAAPFSRPKFTAPEIAPVSTQVEATFGFIDMAGFTALTEAHGDEDAAQLATRFAELTRRSLRRGDRLVKTIGDAVLVTSPNADQGLALAERVFEGAARDPSFPLLRAGLHHGEAVSRANDVFGAAVNLAARVAGEAYAGELLGTASIAEAARRANTAVADLGLVPLKNVREAIPLFSIALVLGAVETPIDPVCQNPVDRRAAVGRLRFHGVEYCFCSLTCAAAFASNPSWHTASLEKKA